MNKRAMNKRMPIFLVLLCAAAAAVLLACGWKTTQSPRVIYVAWSNNQESYSFKSMLRTIEAAGAVPVVLDQALSADLEYDQNNMLVGAKDEHGILTSDNAKKVKNNTWQNSNVEQIMENVNCVAFPGGADISPALYYDEKEWHGIQEDANYSAERDVSDYILISYCLEHDIPILGVCRGMQLLSVVSGAEMIQDIRQWYEGQGLEYISLHRDPEKKDFVAHQVTVLSEDSLLYKITGMDTITGVPSWHHQAVENVDNTRLVVTAIAETDGKQIIEAVERPDKTFCIGVQFHPEVAIRKSLDKEAGSENFMDYDAAMAFFQALSDAGEKHSM